MWSWSRLHTLWPLQHHMLLSLRDTACACKGKVDSAKEEEAKRVWLQRPFFFFNICRLVDDDSFKQTAISRCDLAWHQVLVQRQKHNKRAKCNSLCYWWIWDTGQPGGGLHSVRFSNINIKYQVLLRMLKYR